MFLKLYDLPLTNKKKLMENSQLQLTKKLNLSTHRLNHFAEPVKIEKLAVRYGTPLYIIDEVRRIRRCMIFETPNSS